MKGVGMDKIPRSTVAQIVLPVDMSASETTSSDNQLNALPFLIAIGAFLLLLSILVFVRRRRRAIYRNR